MVRASQVCVARLQCSEVIVQCTSSLLGSGCQKIVTARYGLCLGRPSGPWASGCTSLIGCCACPQVYGMIGRLGKDPSDWPCFYKLQGSLPIYVYLPCTHYQSIHNPQPYLLSSVMVLEKICASMDWGNMTRSSRNILFLETGKVK